ncbi:hypothetical protein BDW75DRAFT_231800 [Aspergillus navahoensis]
MPGQQKHPYTRSIPYPSPSHPACLLTSFNFFESATPLKHPIVMAPLTRLHADTRHVPLPMTITSYEHRATVSGATDAVHQKSSIIFCQLVALARAADPIQLHEEGRYEIHAPSSIPTEPGMPVPVELAEKEIQSIIRDFATAARNAIRAGFDVRFNRRKDQWDGSIPNRARIGLKVARIVADAIGAERVVFHLNPWSTWQRMKMSRFIDDVDCEKKGSVIFLLYAWGKSLPVLVAGGYSPENAESAIQRDYKDHEDAVVFGRRFLAEPDLPFYICHQIPLNQYHRESLYTAMQEYGYTDNPFIEQMSHRGGCIRYQCF